MGGDEPIKRRARRRDPQCLSQAWCGRCGSGGRRAKRAAAAAGRRRRRGPQSTGWQWEASEKFDIERQSEVGR